MKTAIASRIGAAIVMAVVAGGCAGRPYEPRLGNDHPANPSAATAELPPASRTLALPESDANHRDHEAHAVAPTPPAPAAASAHDHGHGATAAAATQPATTRAATFVCPMHPEVTSTDPAARCPKCGMKLRPAGREEASK